MYVITDIGSNTNIASEIQIKALFTSQSQRLTVKRFKRPYMLTVHSQLSEGPLVRNVVVQIPKFDAKPNLTVTLALTLTITLALIS